MTTASRETRSPASTETAASAWHDLGHGASLSPGGRIAGLEDVLTDRAVELVARLHRALDGRRRELLAARQERQAEWDAGAVPTYLPRDSQAVTGDWRVATVPADLRRRRVEITGPVNSAKMVINMLSRNDAGHRADTAMLDFEDSMKPSWRNVVDGVANVAGAARRDLTFEQGEKRYQLDPDDMAKMMVRVRGLHLGESNLRVDGRPVSGGLFDFALSLLHGAPPQLERGETPKFYVPKVEHHLEARWWNDLFVAAQDALGLPRGTLRATFLMETLPAAFQMEEILYEIRDHAAGLNVGRWDKIFSDIKVLAAHPDRILADRASINLDRPWMRSYAERLIEICHARGAWAIGGMAAFTPGKTAARRDEQTAKVVADKKLEASLGHDGCWVSHPYFIGPALEAFASDHQTDYRVAGYDKYPDLLPAGTPPRTLEGLRTNVRVGIAYLRGWNQDIGCVAWDDLMEDLATLEISRAQTYQWLHHRAELEGGGVTTPERVRATFAEELAKIEEEVEEAMAGAPGAAVEAEKAAFREARRDAEEIFCRDRLAPFLSEASELA